MKQKTTLQWQNRESLKRSSKETYATVGSWSLSCWDRDESKQQTAISIISNIIIIIVRAEVRGLVIWDGRWHAAVSIGSEMSPLSTVLGNDAVWTADQLTQQQQQQQQRRQYEQVCLPSHLICNTCHVIHDYCIIASRWPPSLTRK